MFPDDRGGVLVGASLEPAEVCFAVRGLFRVLLVKGGGGGEFDLGLGVVVAMQLARHQAQNG